MSVEPGQRGELSMAEVALIRVPVPTTLRRPNSGSPRSIGVADKPIGVCDNAGAVQRGDHSIELLTRHPRATGTRLAMENESGLRDKASTA